MTIYTCIVGNYDTLKEPSIITPGWKYVCFTDQDFKSDVWEIRKIASLYRDDARQTARLYKIMFHSFIQDEVSIWVDGSFKINCDLDRWMKRAGGQMTLIEHPERDCVYQEIFACINMGKGNPNRLITQLDRYKAAGVPSKNGLISTGIMMRRRTREVMKFCDQWHDELSAGSDRDQVSLAYMMFIHPAVADTIKYNYMVDQEFIFERHLHKKWKQRA